MFLRLQVRHQIRREIQEEIEKQRKSVLEDPNVRGKLLELEALRSQSGMLKNEGLLPATSSVGNVSVSTATSSIATVSAPGMHDSRWYQQQNKTKQVWLNFDPYPFWMLTFGLGFRTWTAGWRGTGIAQKRWTNIRWRECRWLICNNGRNSRNRCFEIQQFTFT